MQPVKVFLAIATLMLPYISTAGDAAFTGSFRGEGRACFGGLFVRTKTIEWNSSFSTCGPSVYEVLHHGLTEVQPKIAYRLIRRQKQCRSEVIELVHYEGEVWSVNGYPTAEAYQNKDLPDWKDSELPERSVMSCGVLRQ